MSEATALLCLARWMTSDLAPIYRCESCGYWEARSEGNPVCPYCCTRCPPGQCPQGWHKREVENPGRFKLRPLPVYLSEAVRRDR